MSIVFNECPLSRFINKFKENLSSEVDKLEITDLTNINQLLERLKREFTIIPLELKKPLPSEPRESKIGRTRSYGDVYMQKVIELDVTIPFEGNCQLFNCSPSLLSSSPVIYLPDNVFINTNNIRIRIILDDLDSDEYNTQIDKIISDLSSNIPIINTEIAPWNNGLENHIIQLLEQRKGVVSKKVAFMEKIGFKINPKSNDFMIPPPVSRKIIPIPVTEANNVTKESIATIQEEVYNDINEVIYNVGKAIERKPSIYKGKHEEDLRDIFLLFLETRYDSTTGVGEAFNKKGKTDILLKYAKDGSILFIAECKFWNGAKIILEGIDQLLSYLTHRESKTALIIFVAQKEFDSVIKTLKEKIKSHQQFKRYVKDSYASSIRYEFTLPEDSQKIIQMEIILFHFPEIN